MEVAEFKYPGVNVKWIRHDDYEEVLKHEQLDHEELSYENVQPVRLTTTDVLVARDAFLELVLEYVVGIEQSQEYLYAVDSGMVLV